MRSGEEIIAKVDRWPWVTVNYTVAMSLIHQNFLAFPPTRLLASIVGALVISVVVSESLLALLPLLVSDFQRLQADQHNPALWALILQILIWSIAGFIAAAFAAALSGSRAAGWAAAGLWLVPTSLSLGLIGLDNHLIAAGGLLIILAGIGGAGLAVRLMATDKAPR